jgi:hypothetical protein
MKEDREMLPGGLKDITTEWLNEALHVNGFLKKDIDISSVEIEPMAVGEGFQSDMARIIPEYTCPDPNLPKSMVAKLPTSYEQANYVAMLFNTYEREIRCYKEVISHSPIRTPGLILGEFDVEHKWYVLILQDCSDCAQVDQIKGLTEKQLRQVVLKIADFHAYWWNSENLASIPWMPGPRSAAAYALVGFYRGCWDMAVNVPEFLAALPKGGKEAGLKIYEYYQWMVEDAAPNDHLTVTHFDFRGDNLFFDESNREDPVVVFDWGAASIYRGALDVAYLVGGSVSLELRRKVEKDMLNLYYNRLLERGVKGYPFEECLRDYLGGLLVYAYIPVLAYSRLDLSSDRGKELARLLTERHFDTIVENNATSILPCG